MPVVSRRARALAAPITLLVLAATGAQPAAASIADAPTAEISWSFPDGTDLPASSPQAATATGHWTVEDPDEDPYAYIQAYADISVDGRQVDSVALNPGHPAEAFSLNTRDLGTHQITVEVIDDYHRTLATETRTVTVTGEKTDLTADWPTNSTVPLGTKAVVTGHVTGHVTGPQGRRVLLQERTGAGNAASWTGVATTTTTADGDYTLTVPTTWYAKHTLRVTTPVADRYDSATSPTRTLAVAPTYPPKGSAKGYRLAKTRFNPCQPVTWRFNPAGAPKSALADIRTALAQATAATGITFTYRGTTKAIPFEARSPINPLGHATFHGFDLAIGFPTPKQVPALKGKTYALGGPTTSTDNPDSRGFTETATAEIALDPTAVKDGTIKPGWGRSRTLGETLLHQVGAALGLTTITGAKAKNQTMGTSPLATDRYGAGDLAGLARIGRAAGCTA